MQFLPLFLAINIKGGDMKNDKNNELHNRDITLEDCDAEAASPDEESVAGEEDPGCALEEFVERDRHKAQNQQHN